MEITCPQEAMSGVYNCMNLRRGCVFEENQREGTPLVQAMGSGTGGGVHHLGMVNDHRS